MTSNGWLALSSGPAVELVLTAPVGTFLDADVAVGFLLAAILFGSICVCTTHTLGHWKKGEVSTLAVVKQGIDMSDLS